MKNRSTSLLLFALAGLFALNVRVGFAQQSSTEYPTDISFEIKSQPHVRVTGAVRSPGYFKITDRMRLLDALSLAGGTNEQAGQTIRVIRFNKCALGGLTIDAKDYKLADLLRGDENANPYLQRQDVVNVFEADAPHIYVMGNVVRPQIIYLKDPLTGTPNVLSLSQSIAITGGLLPDSRTDGILILRQKLGESKTTLITVDYKLIRKGGAKDLLLEPNDVVGVPVRKGKRDCFELISFPSCP